MHKAADPKIDSMLAEAAHATDDSRRTTIPQEFARYTAEQAWYLAPVVKKSRIAFDAQKVTVVPPASGVVHLFNYRAPN